MFEDLYENSVTYDDNLLQAACAVIAEFDLDYALFRIAKNTPDFTSFVRHTAREYKVSAKDLRARLLEILT